MAKGHRSQIKKERNIATQEKKDLMLLLNT